MRDTINTSLVAAVKAQDRRRMCTLRLINAAIKDRDIEARGHGRTGGIADDEVLQLLQKMIKQRDESAKIYQDAGRAELAEQEREEAEIIKGFLPRQMDDAETRDAVAGTVSEIGAAGLRDMGRTMAALKERYAGRMDFTRASAVVKEILA